MSRNCPVLPAPITPEELPRLRQRANLITAAWLIGSALASALLIKLMLLPEDVTQRGLVLTAALVCFISFWVSLAYAQNSSVKYKDLTEDEYSYANHIFSRTPETTAYRCAIAAMGRPFVKHDVLTAQDFFWAKISWESWVTAQKTTEQEKAKLYAKCDAGQEPHQVSPVNETGLHI